MARAERQGVGSERFFQKMRLRVLCVWRLPRYRGPPRPPSRARKIPRGRFPRSPSVLSLAALAQAGCLERAGRCQPADRCLGYVEAPGHICLRFAVGEAPDGFLPLMGSQRRRPAETHATRLCTARLSLVRARISSRSNSARPPQHRDHQPLWCPPMNWRATLKPAPALPMVSKMLSRSCVLRASRSRRVTTSISSGSSRRSTLPGAPDLPRQHFEHGAQTGAHSFRGRCPPWALARRCGRQFSAPWRGAPSWPSPVLFRGCTSRPGPRRRWCGVCP